MKVFLDANVLVSVLNKEYPLFTFSSRLLSLTETKKFKLYTSPVCLAIAFYFSEKKSGHKTAKKKIEILSEKIGITTVDQKVVMDTLANKRVSNFEDGLEFYSAVSAGCICIVTEDKSDFGFSPIEVLGAENFLQQYVWN